MKPESIVEFENLKDFLNYQVESNLVNSAGRKTSSLSRVAQKLGYKSPSILTMILKGQRIPSDDMVAAMAGTWKLNQTEKEFLRLLVQAEREKKKGRDPSETFRRLKQIAGQKKAKTFSISLHQFMVIKDWYFLTIKQLVGSPGFIEDSKWISNRLRKKVTPAQALKALEVLQELKLIQRDPLTKRLVPAVGYTESSHEIPSEAIRLHHRGMLERASEALEEQSVSERQFNSLTFKMDPEKLPLMKERILNFVRELNDEFETSDSNQVYQLNLQLFKHTKEGSGQ